MHTYIKHAWTHRERQFSVIFGTQFRKSWKCYLTVSPCPWHPIRCQKGAGISKSFFHRLHLWKEQHQIRDIKEKLALINGMSSGPIFEKKLLHSSYKMFQILLTWFSWKYLEISVSKRSLGGEGFCQFLRRGNGGRGRGFPCFIKVFCRYTSTPPFRHTKQFW